jgi:Homeodomain-like domain
MNHLFASGSRDRASPMTPTHEPWWLGCIERAPVSRSMPLRRRKRVGQPMEDGVSLPCGGSIEDSVGAKRLVAALIQSVSSEELDAVIVCRVDGASHIEAAEILGVSERTIRRLLERFDAHADKWRKEFAS